MKTKHTQYQAIMFATHKNHDDPILKSWKWQNDKMTKKKKRNKNKTMIAKSKRSKQNKATKWMKRRRKNHYVLKGIYHTITLSSSVESNGPILFYFIASFAFVFASLFSSSFVHIQFKKKKKLQRLLQMKRKNMQLWQQFCNGAKHKVHICWCYAKWILHSCIHIVRVLCLHFCDSINSSECRCCNEEKKII